MLLLCSDYKFIPLVYPLSSLYYILSIYKNHPYNTFLELCNFDMSKKHFIHVPNNASVIYKCLNIKYLQIPFETSFVSVEKEQK